MRTIIGFYRSRAPTDVCSRDNLYCGYVKILQLPLLLLFSYLPRCTGSGLQLGGYSFFMFEK